MSFSLASIGAKARRAVPVDRLLQNVGVLARGAGQNEAGTNDDASGEAAAEAGPSTRPTSYTAGEPIPLVARVTAWWHGDVLSQTAAKDKTVAAEEAVPVDLTRWDADRLTLVQRLWGESFLEPGGATRTRKLFAHVMPNSKQTVLDLTAGLGGTAFTLAQDQGLWMDALEPDPDLAAEALKAASMSGLASQVPVSPVDIDVLDVAQNKYHLAYSRERLFALAQKQEVLAAAAECLKNGGSLMITDLMVPSADIMDSDGYRAWASTEPVTPQPWTIALYAKSLQDFGLKVATRQDLTSEYLEDIHSGWARISRDLEAGEFDRSLGRYLLAEGEVWSRRTKALQDGVISYCRIIARRMD